MEDEFTNQLLLAMEADFAMGEPHRHHPSSNTLYSCSTCGKEYAVARYLDAHERTCVSSKRDLSDLLEEANRLWEARKRRKLNNIDTSQESTFPSTSRPYHQNPEAPEDDITPLPVSDENESALILSQNSFAEPVASGSRLPNESIAPNIMENAASPVASGSRLPNEPIAGHIAEPTENANESGTNPILTQNITADPEDATAFRLSVRKGKRPQIASRRRKQDEQRVSGFPSALASAEEWARTTAAAQHSTEPSFLSNAQLEALGLPGVNLMDLLAPQPGNEVAEGPSHGLSAEFELNGTGSLPQHVTEEYGQSGPLHVAGESAFHNRVGGRQI
ncbi:hypothetical protein DFP72DRAFT_839171 [Ephemerocybe angulata]|uniref:C2H2-type domain-containing protein n=1 Tax=Ephemerocybe angulata TaxID=980116 RepID=A0A8H6IIZ1_9AGAR|nr:hypothetical protein DFP72DRAFT_839171 [Tulosesus angulatus]